MKKNKTKKKFRKVSLFFKAIGKLIDKKIITPITKFILKISEKLGTRTNKFEKWLVKKNTLILISLIMAIIIFIAVDKKSLILVDSYAEVLHDQKVEAVYNTEKYVVEGLPETADVTIIGKKMDMYLAKQLSKGTVNVDISNLKEGTHKVSLNYESVVDSVDYNISPSTVTVIISPKVSTTKTAIIDTINKDKLDPEYSISNVEINQEEIIVKGTEEMLKEVATIRVLVDASKLVEIEEGNTVIENIPLIAYNKNGKTVDVEMVPSKVDATISINSYYKEVPIKVIPKGEIQFGKAISSITTSETKITVYGDPDAINKIEYLPVEVDVTKLNSNKTFNVSLVAPQGIRKLSQSKTKVTVTLGEEESKEIEDIMIETINLNDNYKAQSLEGKTTTNIVVKGTKEVLEKIDKSKIKAIIDLSKYTKEGDYDVPIVVSGDDNKVIYIPKTTKIKIRIKQK